ncbi:DnaJ domain-containing protein [Halovenus halobia]|uniref:DnaJ domain-containing protein n=1 Tax=Halovenus halobia TaxID=3396622 RepID=UPI003F568BED
MPEDYYERLGVSRDASDSTIKSAFRERIKETHPDVSDDEAASDQTKRLIEAKDVLTDEEERAKYDRVGHEAYVSHSGTTTTTDERDDATQSQDNTTTTDASATSENNSASGTGGTSHQSENTDSRRTSQQRESTGASGQAGHSATWYDTSRQQRSGTATDRHQVWDTDQSYAVGDSPGMFSLRELVTSQRAIVLLGTTFVIYPVLLFGALFRSFPTAANLIVAMCIILVVAFLQSVPQVGMVVFGVWLVLLPVILFGVIGVPVLSITGVLSMAAVAFPFGLSVLTWIAIGPSRRQF